MKSRNYREKTWVDPRQSFGPSTIHGMGSFAQVPIKAGEVVEIIGGRVMTEEEFWAFVRTVDRFNAVQIGENLHLVELPEITQQRGGGSLNHSCDSNLWMLDEVTVAARRDIMPGEELTVDYALFTGEEGLILEHDCRCGSPNCRQTITGSDWKLPEVQQRYYPHFSPFINARIEALREKQK